MFSGGGTAVLAAKQLGLAATGIDIMPFSIAIGRAKVGQHDASQIKKLGEQILQNALDRPLPSGVDLDFAKRLYDPKSFELLLNLSSLIHELKESEDSKAFLLTASISTAERAVGAVKAGGFTRDHGAGGTEKRSYPPVARTCEDVAILFQERVQTMTSELVSWEPDSPRSINLLGDARHIPVSDTKYRWVISSPPYPNRQDYTRVFASELLLTFSLKSEDHRRLRLETLRSHLEAKPPKTSDPDYIEPTSVTRAVDQITAELYARKVEAQGLSTEKKKQNQELI